MRFFALAASRHFQGSGEGIFLSCERVDFPYQKYDFLHWRLASYFWAVEKGFPPMGLAASRLFLGCGEGIFSSCEIANFLIRNTIFCPGG